MHRPAAVATAVSRASLKLLFDSNHTPSATPIPEMNTPAGNRNAAFGAAGLRRSTPSALHVTM